MSPDNRHHISSSGLNENIRFADIFDLGEIQRIQDLFSDATGVASIITMPDGTPITKSSNFCNLCNLIGSTSQGASDCHTLDEIVCKYSFVPERGIVSQCANMGMWGTSVRICVNGQFLANWIIGQVRRPDVDLQEVVDYAKHINADPEEVIKAFYEVPEMSAEKFRKVADMLYVYANGLSEKAYCNYQLKLEIQEKERARDLLEESERSKSVLLSNLPGMAYRCKMDPYWTMEFVSEGCVGLTGYVPSDLVSNRVVSFNELILPEYRDFLYQSWTQAVEKRETLAVEYQIRTADGRIKWVWEQGTPVFNSAGDVVALEGLVIDISHRKETEESLRIREEKYRSIFENVNDVFYQLKLDGIILEVSPSVKRYVPLSREEIIGRSFFNFYHNQNEQTSVLNEIIEKGEVQDFIIEVKIPDSHVKFISVNGRLVLDSQGKPSYIEGTVRDISKRKAAEQALQESEFKLRSYFDNAPHGVFVADANGHYLEVNQAASRITGYSREELCSMEPQLLIAEESLVVFREHFQKSVRDGYASDEFVVVSKNRDKVYCKVDTVKLAENSFLGFVADISERKQSEEILRQSEKFLLETQQLARLGNFSINIETGEWSSSEVLKSILGIDAEFDKTSRSWFKLVEPESYVEIQEYFQNCILNNNAKFDRVFKTVKRGTDEEKWVHVVAEAKLNESGKVTGIIGTIQDITELQNITNALRKSEALYHSVLNTSPDAVVVTSPEGIIRMVSPATVTIYGCPDESFFIGRNMFDFLSEEDRDRAQLNAALMLESYLGSQEYSIARPDNTFFVAEINGDVIRDEDGQPTAIVFIIRDITERKNVELALKRSQEQLKTFAKHLESVREEERIMLAREIHDELAQILIAIQIDLGIIKQQVLKYLTDEETTLFLQNFNNLSSLVNNTIKTTRKIMSDLRPEVLYLVGFVEAAGMYIRSFQKRHNIKCNFHSEIPDLKLTSQESVTLYRIFQDSLSNVAKHSGATSVDINIYCESDKLILEVVDNGIGFDQSKKRKPGAFGLIGMSERVYLLDGEFKITSRIGEGTTLRIQIPYRSGSSSPSID